MAYTAPRVSQGFEYIGNLMQAPGEDPGLFELVPNTAFSMGNAVYIPAPTNAGTGKATNCSGSTPATGILGVIGVPVSTTTGTQTIPVNGSTSLVQAPVMTNRYNIYRVTFSGHIDGTATSGSTTTLGDTANITSGTNYTAGGAIWIYAGTNAGQIRTISSQSTTTVTWINPMPAAIDTTSKYILLPGAQSAAYTGINVGSYIQLATGSASQVAVNANPTAPGQCIVKAIEFANLMLQVMFTQPLFL